MSTAITLHNQTQPNIIDAEIIQDTQITSVWGNIREAKQDDFKKYLFDITECSYERAIALWISEKSSTQTKRNYKRVIEKFKKWYPIDYTEITSLHIKNYKQWLQFIYTNNTTVSLYLNIIKSFFKFCTNNRFIFFNPTETTKNQKPQDITHQRILGDKEMRSLEDNSQGEINDLITFLRLTGSRISEALNLDCNQRVKILPNGKVRFYVMGKGKKLIKKYLPIAFWDKLSAKPFPFMNTKGGKLSYQVAYKDFKKVVANSNLSSHISFHWIRHFAATKYIEQTNDIKAASLWLGHSSTAITLDKYKEVNDTEGFVLEY